MSDQYRQSIEALVAEIDASLERADRSIAEVRADIADGIWTMSSVNEAESAVRTAEALVKDLRELRELLVRSHSH